ncbi:G-protein coupled receptor 37-like 1 [Genypterus blacodes]|uniref:G-protein coupled receptor 37-like 1 n=1 Tax=Genypterus blacodes TaxID=154954 RepID=UPI003F76F3DF
MRDRTCVPVWSLACLWTNAPPPPPPPPRSDAELLHQSAERSLVSLLLLLLLLNFSHVDRMACFLVLLLLFLSSVELRHVQPAGAEEGHSRVRASPDRADTFRIPDAHLQRSARGATDEGPRKRNQQPSNGYRQPRPPQPDGYHTTPRSDPFTPSRAAAGNGTGLFPVTGGSSWAYLVLLLALLLFAAGIVGNLALMCIVWHSFYLKNTWNSIFAGWAFWDFIVLFFCLPVVVFHELTLKRLLGDVSCRLVPYLEVTSQGVATFSLCALSIDRFHVATSPGPLQPPQVEPCQSILAKLSVIWLGSMVLAAPELLLWQLVQGAVSLPESPAGHRQGGSAVTPFSGPSEVFLADICVRQPSLDLPENIYSLVLTYHEARMWWFFGCYLCLPLLFILACDVVTRHVVAQRLPQSAERRKATGRCSPSSVTSSSSAGKKNRHVKERRLRSTVLALTGVYVACSLPESICNITLAYVPLPVPSAAPALSLIGQFLIFARSSATPVLLLCLCRSLGQAFMDCCCCCCEECLPNPTSSLSSSSSTPATLTTPSTLSSPVSPSLCSPSPCSLKKEKVKIEPEASETSAAIGTPC